MGGENSNIPPLCSCGAQVENIKSVKKGANDQATAMCASNCQFYKNEKLNDIFSFVGSKL